MRDQFGPCLLTLATLALAAAAAVAAPADDVPPPGRLIDVGGYRLHLHCAGSGSPTVVIDGGAGTWSIFYSHIQSALAGEMRVCTYDRAGLGWSERGRQPRTSQVMAEELHRLLHAAGITPPLLLVGHSLGGYTVRVYQQQYPEEVAGLVLVEAGHEGQWQRLPPEWGEAVRNQAAYLRQRAEQARQGSIAASEVQPGGFTRHSPQWRAAHVAAQLRPQTYVALAEENEGAFESARQVPRGRLGNLPLVVLTARRSFDAFAGSGLDIEPANRIWLELQHELAHLSTNVAHLFSEQDHALHTSDPPAMVAAIRRGAAMVKGTPRSLALGLGERVLPAASSPAIDRLLIELEEAYRSMDPDRLVALFTADLVQLDVPRRVHVKGRPQWLEWTRLVNGSHQAMERQHRGRFQLGDWVVAEVEWAGRVNAAALDGAADRDYRYSGLVLLQIRDGRIARQIIYGDAPTLREQLMLPPSPAAAGDRR